MDANNNSKRRGRPCTDINTHKKELVGIRLTEEEYKKLKQIAFESGVKMSALFLKFLPEILGEETRH